MLSTKKYFSVVGRTLVENVTSKKSICPALGFVAIYLGWHSTGNYNLESGTTICKKSVMCKKDYNLLWK